MRRAEERVATVLCELVKNPFPDDARQAAEVLANLDVEATPLGFDRAIFAFQIVSYFLAGLAAAHLEPAFQRRAMDDLYGRLCSFNADMTNPVRFLDYVLCAEERNNVVVALYGEAGDLDISALKTNKLALFEFVGAYRVDCYGQDLHRPALNQFYHVARRLLLHMSGREPQSVPAMVVGNMLMGIFIVFLKVVKGG